MNARCYERGMRPVNHRTAMGSARGSARAFARQAILGGATVGALLTGCAAQPPSLSASPPAVASAEGTRAAAPREAGLTEMVERALPAVALILSSKPNGTTGYGSGLIVGDDGRILTNLHVIDGATELSAMLFKPGRVSYTPMDGGLERYIFEHSKELLPLTVIGTDRVADLALVKVEADTSFAPALTLSTEAMRPGERVFALGHPQETVWSFTTGVVSALHNGAIQHDAVISNGSSGGPLLNARGEVIGINTARVISEARGLAFARPIAMASVLLKRPMDRRDLDLSSPERAVFTCWHAVELMSPSSKDCYDWGGVWEVLVMAVDDLKGRRLSAAEASAVARLSAFVSEPGALARARTRFASDPAYALKVHAGPPFRFLTISVMKAAGLIAADDPGLPMKPELPEMAELRASYVGRLRERGAKGDLSDPKVIQEVLRKGMRIESSRRSGDSRVWFLITGRNFDGSPFSYSECWVKWEGRWLEREPPLAADMEALPAGWPPPLHDMAPLRRAMAADILARLAGAGPARGAPLASGER